MKRKINTGKFYRDVAIEYSRADKKKRTVELSFSSEEPFQRYFGTEILDHGRESVRLGRLAKGGPLLLDHDTKEQVGVVERAWIQGGKCRAVVRFSKSASGEEVFSDVLDGIRQNVSVGYQIHKMKQDESDPENPVFRATDWEPLEISIVAVPADTSVGFGRSAPAAGEVETIIEYAKESFAMKPTSQSDDAAGKERHRVEEILAIGRKFNAVELAQKAISDGTAVDAFRTTIMDKMTGSAPLRTGNDPSLLIGLQPHEVQRYSLSRAILALADHKFVPQAGFELECSRAVSKRIGRDPKGLLVPLDVQLNYAKRDITYGGTGANLVGTEHMDAHFIDVLRNRMLLVSLGAQMLSGLVGNVSIPKKTGASTAYWIANDGSGTITESTPTFGAVPMVPHTVAGLVEYSHRMLIQSSPDVEQLVRQDLADTVAVAVDAAGINGTGDNDQPTGIMATESIGTVSFAAATPTFAEVVEFETDVLSANVDPKKCAYLTTPALCGGMKTQPKATGYPVYVWENSPEPGEGRVNGYRAFATQQMPAGYVLFGDFSQLLIGQWGILELAVDPYTGFASGNVRVRAMFDCDLGVRHAAAFSAGHFAG